MLTRLMLALVLVTLGVDDVAAGRKCIKYPDVVMWTKAADVHENGVWHRTTKAGEKTGKLSRGAYARWYGFYIHRNNRSTATEAQAVACLDALIADETSKAATKACTLKPAKQTTPPR